MMAEQGKQRHFQVGDTGCDWFVIRDAQSKEKVAEGRAEMFVAAEQMLEALELLLEHYTRLVNSGDCGFWDPEGEEPVKSARAALASAQGDK